MWKKTTGILLVCCLVLVFCAAPAMAESPATVTLANGLTLENMSYGYTDGADGYNPDSVGSLWCDGTATGPANLARVRIAGWLDEQPTAEEAQEMASTMVSVWQRSESSLEARELPMSAGGGRPVYARDLGKTQYLILAGLDTGVNLVGYAVIRVEIPDGSTPAPEEDPVVQFVARSYSLILGRDGDAEGILFWANMLKNGTRTGADIVSDFCNSAEFTNRGLSSGEIVNILYNTMLNRSPDEGGLAYWTAQLDNGASSDAIISGFAGSEEFAGICAKYGIVPCQNSEPDPSPEPEPQQGPLEDYIRRSYSLILGREGEAEGIQYWANLLRTGAAAGADIIHQFCGSQEFLSRDLPAESIVEILYHTMLDRSPDEGGLAYWTEQLNNGASPDTIISGFAGSEEFALICAQYGINP